MLLATFRDACFLSQQLASIHEQDCRDDLALWVSRDCDTDAIGTILNEYATSFAPGRFSLLAGPRRGCAANFLSMVCNQDIQADYFAYADQDDIWLSDKLSRAIDRLERIPQTVPALYGSRSLLIDAQAHCVGLTHPLRRPPGFRNALTQCVFAGHSMVMNRAARKLLCAAGVSEVYFHDWWTYLLVSGAGGHIIYDPRPAVQYRLHERNRTGYAFSHRVRRLISGRVGVAANVRALSRSRHLLSAANRTVLDRYSKILDGRLAVRLRAFRETGAYRQTRMQDCALFMLALLHKL